VVASLVSGMRSPFLREPVFSRRQRNPAVREECSCFCRRRTGPTSRCSRNYSTGNCANRVGRSAGTWLPPVQEIAPRCSAPRGPRPRRHRAVPRAGRGPVASCDWSPSPRRASRLARPGRGVPARAGPTPRRAALRAPGSRDARSRSDRCERPTYATRLRPSARGSERGSCAGRRRSSQLQPPGRSVRLVECSTLEGSHHRRATARGDVNQSPRLEVREEGEGASRGAAPATPLYRNRRIGGLCWLALMMVIVDLQGVNAEVSATPAAPLIDTG
jgi:hypothetical protein